MNNNLDNIMNKFITLIKLKNDLNNQVRIIKNINNFYNISVNNILFDYDMNIMNKDNGYLITIIYSYFFILHIKFKEYLEKNNYKYKTIKTEQQSMNTNIFINNEEQLIKILNDLFLKNDLYLKVITIF